MLRRIYLGMLLILLSIGIGAWSVDYALHHFDGFDRLQIGQWEAFPQSGTQAADPYARARRLRFEILALGRAEGLVFTLWHDERGEKLHVSCSYRLEGSMPEAGFFTLYAVAGDRTPKKNQRGRPYEINSDNALRRSQGDYLITISPRPQSGNWLSIDTPPPDGEGEDETYGLTLVLYDTPITTTTGMAQLDMPRLTRLERAEEQGGRCG